MTKKKETPNFKCNKCKVLEIKDLRYVISINGEKHLVGNCDICGTRFLPYQEGLDIPTVKSKKRSKKEKKEYLNKISPKLFD